MAGKSVESQDNQAGADDKFEDIGGHILGDERSGKGGGGTGDNKP